MVVGTTPVTFCFVVNWDQPDCLNRRPYDGICKSGFRQSGDHKAKLATTPEQKGLLDLPRFRGEMRAWDQALWLDVMLSSGLVAFFGSAPGGAILPSRPA